MKARAGEKSQRTNTRPVYLSNIFNSLVIRINWPVNNNEQIKGETEELTEVPTQATPIHSG